MARAPASSQSGPLPQAQREYPLSWRSWPCARRRGGWITLRERDPNRERPSRFPPGRPQAGRRRRRRHGTAWCRGRRRAGARWREPSAAVLSRVQAGHLAGARRHDQRGDGGRGATPPSAAWRAAVDDRLASGGAGPRARSHGGGHGPARLRRQQQATGRGEPRELFQARHGARSGGGHAPAGIRAVRSGGRGPPLRTGWPSIIRTG